MFRQNTSLRMSERCRRDDERRVRCRNSSMNRTTSAASCIIRKARFITTNDGPNSPCPISFARGSSPPPRRRLGTYSAWNNRAVVLTARSSHPGGVQAGLVDGSVRFVEQRRVGGLAESGGSQRRKSHPELLNCAILAPAETGLSHVDSSNAVPADDPGTRPGL